jgi:hypothetical protein
MTGAQAASSAHAYRRLLDSLPSRRTALNPNPSPHLQTAIAEQNRSSTQRYSRQTWPRLHLLSQKESV